MAYGERFVLKSYQLCRVKVLISMQIAALHSSTYGLGIWEYIDMICSLLRYWNKKLITRELIMANQLQ